MGKIKFKAFCWTISGMKLICVFIGTYGNSSAFIAPASCLCGANLNFGNYHIKTSYYIIISQGII